MNIRVFVVAMALTALGLSGCSEVSAEDVAKATSERTSTLVSELGASTEWISQLSTLDEFYGGFEQVVNSFSSVPVLGEGETCTEGVDCPPEEEVWSPTAPTQAEINEANALLQKFIKERIFTEANVESSDADSAVFLIQGDDICTDGTFPAEPACVKGINQVEIRIRATPVSDEEIHLTLLLGPARTETLTLKLRDGMAAIEINLGGAKSALERMADLSGGEVALPSVMQGKVEFRLQKNKDKDFTVSVSVLAPIRIEADGVTFTTGVKSPVGALNFDGNTKRIQVDLDLGETELSVPFDGIKAGQTMTFHLSGASYSVSVAEGDQELEMMHLGLGDAQSWVKLDGQMLLSMDLNETTGRHFDVKYRMDTDGQLLTTVVPEFNMTTKFFFKPLEASPEFEVPSFYQDETYQVKLVGGGAPVLKAVAADETKGFPGGIKLVKGSLTMETSSSAAEKVVVAEGQCLVAKEAAEGSHPLLGAFQSVACP